MPSISAITGRTSSIMVSSQLLAALSRTQSDLLQVQQQISTGKSVTKPSDAPDKAAAILLVQKLLQARDQTDRNLQNASAILDNTDQALKDVTDQLITAQGIASSQVGIGSSTDTRKNQAAVIDSQIQALIDIANRKYQDVSLFGGSTNPARNGPVFVSQFGGVRYVGSTSNLNGDVGLDQSLSINSNGVDAFGALSTRVQSPVNLNPQATAATRLADINGAQNQGFHRGSVVVNIDGANVTVDLSDADTLGDVVTRINAAIDAAAPGAGGLAITGAGFNLTAGAGHTIKIDESGGGQSAADLGLKITASGATTAGGDVAPRLTKFTTLASLGTAVDFASGLLVTQGTQTKVIDFSSAKTVQDMINTVHNANLGLRLEINGDATGLNLVSEVSGVDLSVGENGGTTAGDLGLRTFGLNTQLADFNHGLGVDNPAGDDFSIRLHDGSTFKVNIDGVTDVGGVIAAIKSAATAAGVTVGAPGATGTGLNVGLATTGNGLVLEDGTTGAGDFKVVQEGLSLAADNLGIYTNAGAGSTINGADRTKVQVESVFSHLIALRDALVNDDSRGITFAGGAIEQDVAKVTQARADVGVRSNRVQQQQGRSADLKLSEQSMLSQLQDADLTEVITRFMQLQQQLEATLRVGAQTMQTSLLDFLR